MQPNMRIISKQFSGEKADVFHRLLSDAREIQLAFIRRAVTVNKTLWHLPLCAYSVFITWSYLTVFWDRGKKRLKCASVTLQSTLHCTMLTGGDGGTLLATPTHTSHVDKRPIS